jgi:hypothetical protein
MTINVVIREREGEREQVRGKNKMSVNLFLIEHV